MARAHDSLVLACCKLLKHQGWIPHRTNQGRGAGRMVRGRRVFCQWNDPGMPDIYVQQGRPVLRMYIPRLDIPPGTQRWWIECKTGNDKLTKAQAAFGADEFNAGGFVLVVRNVGELARRLGLRTT